MKTSCPFCSKADSDIVARNEDALAFADEFPITPGHTLVVPARHEVDFFALTELEQSAILALVRQVRNQLLNRFRPDGFNIGVNVGGAAGQTVDHAHLHVIPRYTGDVSDPRGGVRWVVPSRAAYWSPSRT